MATLQLQEGILIVRLHGNLDLENHQQLRAILSDILDRSDAALVRIDLSRVTNISSSGFGALVDFSRRLPEQRSLILANLSRACSQVLSLLNLAPFFRIEESRSPASPQMAD